MVSTITAGPALTFLGMLTSPHQDGPGTADYVVSLARDTTLTQVPALFPHYSNMLTGLGAVFHDPRGDIGAVRLLTVPLLVRGVRAGCSP